MAEPTRDPIADLRRIAFLLERSLESSYRVKAFRTAAAALAALPPSDVVLLAQTQELRQVKGIGERTAAVVEEAVAGQVPGYLTELEARTAEPLAPGGEALRAALRGDLHTHSDWSDGGSPIDEMATTAASLGHEYTVLTDHSPRLTVARGLTEARLLRQLEVVAELNTTMAAAAAPATSAQVGSGLGGSEPGGSGQGGSGQVGSGRVGSARGFQLLTGIEVDILDDGRLDQTDQLLRRLDVVVASVHSELRMPSAPMTRRMIAAITTRTPTCSVTAPAAT